MKPGDVQDMLAHVHDWRQALWPLAASIPQGRASRQASQLRARLSDAEKSAHELRRILDAMAAHPTGLQRASEL